MSQEHYRSSGTGQKGLLLALAFITIGAVMGSIAGFLLIHHRQTIPKPPPQAARSSPPPSTIEPTKQAVDTYSVASTLPKYITIPAIDIDKARVTQLGLTKNNQIAVPDNIHDTGWYNESTKPGQPGAMFIYGHVSSWQARGVFYNLKRLKPGDTITVTRGDDRDFSYRVVATKIYPFDHVDMSAVLRPVTPNRPGLNIMTCTGKIIKGTSEFSERLVVFATLANPS